MASSTHSFIHHSCPENPLRVPDSARERSGIPKPLSSGPALGMWMVQTRSRKIEFLLLSVSRRAPGPPIGPAPALCLVPVAAQESAGAAYREHLLWWHFSQHPAVALPRQQKLMRATILSPAAPGTAAVSLLSRKVFWRDLLSLDQLDRVVLKPVCVS